MEKNISTRKRCYSVTLTGNDDSQRRITHRRYRGRDRGGQGQVTRVEHASQITLGTLVGGETAVVEGDQVAAYIGNR